MKEKQVKFSIIYKRHRCSSVLFGGGYDKQLIHYDDIVTLDEVIKIGE